MQTVEWNTLQVQGRDEVLRDIERRAHAFGDTVLQDARAIMHDYEVDMYRLVLTVGKRYGMGTAFELMSDSVAEKRLRWMDQAAGQLDLSGSEVAKGLGVYIAYFRPKAEDFQVLEETQERVLFRRRDYVNAIFHACDVLGLDVIDVSNKVYARAMNRMLERVDPGLRHVVLTYHDGWYDEMIEFHPDRKSAEEPYA